MRSSKRRLITLLVLLPLVGYAAVCIGMFLLQDRLVYHPESGHVASPSDWEVPHEEVFFQAKDNVKLHGWFLHGDPHGPVIIYCHGKNGNISHREAMLTLLHNLKLNVFIFDYRGYGKSAGFPTEEGTAMDARAAYQWLTVTRRVPSSRIIVMGRSLGGGVASRLASEVPSAGLILMSTFTSLSDAGQWAYPWLPVKQLLKYRYPNLENINKVTVPVLILHSQDDEVVPFFHGRALFKAANSPKQFVELKGGHDDSIHQSHAALKGAIRAYMNGLSPQEVDR